MVASLNASVNIAIPALSDADWQQACDYLAHRDRVLRKVIAQAPTQRWCVQPDAFAVLARAVVWQQLSATSGQQLWKRYQALPNSCTPQGVLALADDALKAIRMPQRKIGYLKDLAQLFVAPQGAVVPWADLDDEAIAEKIAAVRGLGRWNAEMFLIFHLQRPNVVPIDDAALQSGISANYFSGDPVSRSDVREVAQAWQPWSSVGAWLIWQTCKAMPMGLDTV